MMDGWNAVRRMYRNRDKQEKNGQVNRQMVDKRIGRLTDKQKDGRRNRRRDGWAARQIKGKMDSQTDGR